MAKVKTEIKLENKSVHQDPAYHAVLDDFKKHCQNIIDKYEEDDTMSPNEGGGGGYVTFGDKFSVTTSAKPDDSLSNKLILLCAQLSFWIYVPSDKIPQPFECENDNDSLSRWHYKKIIESKQTQIAQWAFLQHSSKPKSAFLVFKGTDPNLIFDMIADTGVIPMPIWCKEDALLAQQKVNRAKHDEEEKDNKHDNDNDIDIDANDWQFCAHSGMYASLMRDFHRIWKIINHRISTFDKLYIIGHSLGGGLAKLFALESIINKYLASNKQMKVITFGAPVVISYENNFQSLSRSAKQTLYKLHNICHCFVNRFDPVTRVPTRVEWMLSVIPYALRKIIADQMSAKMKLPSFLKPLVKTGVKSGISKFVEYVEKYLDLLQSYHPFGQYYFYINDCDKPFISKNQTVIEELLGFIPPHKIVTSAGKEVRVSHYSTKVHAIGHHSRFSLAKVTDLTLSINNLNVTNSNANNEKGDKNDKKKKKKDEEKEINIIDLLTKKSDINPLNGDDDGEGILYDHNATYIAIETDNDEVKQLFQKKKLSEKGWLMLMSNHLCEQYIDIFKMKMQQKKSKYPLLPPKDPMKSNHFGAPPSVDDDSNVDEIKQNENINDDNLKQSMIETGKNWWNKASIKAKQTLQKEQKLLQKEYPSIAKLTSFNSSNDVKLPTQQKPIQQQAQQPQQPQQPQYQQPYYQQQQQQYYVRSPQQISGAQPQQPQYPQQPYYQPQYQYPQHPQQQPQQPQIVYRPSPNSQYQLGNTQYAMAQSPNNTHYVVYKQPHQLQQQQPSTDNKSNNNQNTGYSYPSLGKR